MHPFILAADVECAILRWQTAETRQPSGGAVADSNGSSRDVLDSKPEKGVLDHKPAKGVLESKPADQQHGAPQRLAVTTAECSLLPTVTDFEVATMVGTGKYIAVILYRYIVSL